MWSLVPVPGSVTGVRSERPSRGYMYAKILKWKRLLRISKKKSNKKKTAATTTNKTTRRIWRGKKCNKQHFFVKMIFNNKIIHIHYKFNNKREMVWPKAQLRPNFHQKKKVKSNLPKKKYKQSERISLSYIILAPVSNPKRTHPFYTRKAQERGDKPTFCQ